MKKNAGNIPGINIQWPWSRLILDGTKSIETRRYPLPEHYVGVSLALIETPGPLGKQKGGVEKARIIGIIRFVRSFEYANKTEWEKDFLKHRVPQDDPDFAFDPNKRPWAWQVEVIESFGKPLPAPVRRGIVFTKSCGV